MDPTTKVALIAAIPATIGALLSALLSLLNRFKIREVHLSINSRLTQLVEATREAAHAEGRREGIASVTAVTQK